MLINGTEREFLFSIGAFVDISKLCPDGNIERLGELLGDNNAEQMRTIVRLAVILNQQSESFNRFCGREWHPPLTEAELMTMSFAEFGELSKAVMTALAMGRETTVELENEKKTEMNLLR